MQFRAALPERVQTGDLVVAHVAVVNNGGRTVTVSARFHLHEGDVSLEIDGERHIGAEQADSQARSVELMPGSAVGAGVALVASDRGVLFDSAGVHDVVMTYWSAETGRLVSTASEIEVEAGAQTLAESAARDVSRGQVEEEQIDRSTAPLFRLVVAASAIRAGGWPSLSAAAAEESIRAELSSRSSSDIAWIATALAPPAPYPDDPLLLIARDLVAGDELASAIVACEAFPAVLLG